MSEPTMETRDFRLSISNLKALDDAGQFEGLASVYGVTDSYGDVVARGAFTKTIAERGAHVPILWSHDVRAPIGLGTLEDSREGLRIKGKLVLTVAKAAEVYALLKEEVVRGLSIGYATVKDAWEDNVRVLKEIKLYEVSLVTFGACPGALVSTVKTIEPGTVAVLQQLADDIERFARRGEAVPVRPPVTDEDVADAFEAFTRQFRRDLWRMTS